VSMCAGIAQLPQQCAQQSPEPCMIFTSMSVCVCVYVCFCVCVCVCVYLCLSVCVCVYVRRKHATTSTMRPTKPCMIFTSTCTAHGCLYKMMEAYTHIHTHTHQHTLFASRCTVRGCFCRLIGAYTHIRTQTYAQIHIY